MYQRECNSLWWITFQWTGIQLMFFIKINYKWSWWCGSMRFYIYCLPHFLSHSLGTTKHRHPQAHNFNGACSYLEGIYELLLGSSLWYLPSSGSLHCRWITFNPRVHGNSSNSLILLVVQITLTVKVTWLQQFYI